MVFVGSSLGPYAQLKSKRGELVSASLPVDLVPGDITCGETSRADPAVVRRARLPLGTDL